ncbi:MAG: DUF1320 domain-containing protein [Rikenellaceae bacterium]|jgi:phage gp36-like protein|nr:DUF1320 domain-containing protein [Rikenellaceae bacterium]
MLIEIEELRSALYEYQADQIAEDNDTTIRKQILAAEELIRSYLVNRYDVSAIWDAVGDDRNPLLLEHIKSIAVWYLLRLSNPDVLFEKAEKYYQMTMEWLDKVADGLLNPTLPPIDADGDGRPDDVTGWGCSEKRNDNSY